MGEFLFRKIFLFTVLICILIVFSVGVFAAHPLYQSFSSPESGFVFDNFSGVVSASDSVIYGIGYYSINGSAWENFNLSGNLYNGNADWLSSSASSTLPVFGVGEHYVIVYSCTYNPSNSSWNCHENKWQLIIINNTINSTVNNTVNNTNSSSCSDNCSSLGYQCGTQTICNASTNCGGCSAGYDCTDGICKISQPGTCGGITCKSNEYCSNNVCLLTVSRSTYFVATNGNDNNPGNFTHPWKTWQKAVEELYPGDIVYIRGGIYKPTTHIMYNGWNTGAVGMRIFPSGGMGRSGTATNPIRYFAYPPDWEVGNYPILDGSIMTPNSQGYFMGIDIERAEYIHLKGLTVSHIHQVPYSTYGLYTQAWGIMASDVANIVYELLSVHDIDGVAYTHYSGAWTPMDSATGSAPPSLAYFENDNTLWLNCDAYNLYDQYARTPGNAADGWKTGGWYGNHLTWEGCRAFNYTDDGFNPDNNAYHLFRNCWARSGIAYGTESGGWAFELNGWKVTGVGSSRIPNYTIGGESFARFENCIAADNYHTGFGNNILVEYENTFPNNAEFYNCLAYHNEEGFRDEGSGFGGTRSSIYRNNIAYGSTSSGWGFDPLYEVAIYRPSVYDESHNTWRHIVYPQGQDDWPGWEYNPAFTVTDDDFVSLDTSQLMKPRKADGSLPDITFGHLSAGSDLIDKGIDVSLNFSGSAPDLGPFENQP